MEKNRTQFNTKSRIDGLSLRMNELQNMTKGITLNEYIPICLKISCANFAELTKELVKPFDVRFNQAMIKAMNFVLEKTDAKLGYTYQGEAYFTYFKWSETDKSSVNLDTQQLTAEVISLFTAKLNVALMEYFPEKDMLAYCSSKVWNVPSIMDAAELYACEQTKCFKVAVDQSVKHFAPQVSSENMNVIQKLQLLKEYGVKPSNLPEFFITGTFSMKTCVENVVTAGSPLFGKQDIELKDKVINYYIKDLSKDLNTIDELLFEPIFNERRFFEKKNAELQLAKKSKK